MKQIGDIVRLKSGGPGGGFITVVEYSAKTRMVSCAWIAEDGSPQDYTYPEDALDGPFVYRTGVVQPVV